MFELSFIHSILKSMHIIAGIVGLLAFWIPVLSKKGSRLHVACGKVFALCAYVVGISALITGIWGATIPQSFLKMQDFPDQAIARMAGNVRFLYAILTYLAATILAGVTMGVRVLRTRNHPEQLSTPGLRSLQHLAGAAAFLVGVFGLVSVFTAESGGRYIFCIVLGFVGVVDWRETSNFLKNPRPTPRAWWYKHMECMIGCGIGFHTAFLLFGIRRLAPGAALPGAWNLIPWILPTAIGLPVMFAWIKHYKRKFGEFEERVI